MFIRCGKILFYETTNYYLCMFMFASYVMFHLLHQMFKLFAPHHHPHHNVCHHFCSPSPVERTERIGQTAWGYVALTLKCTNVLEPKKYIHHVLERHAETPCLPTRTKHIQMISMLQI